MFLVLTCIFILINKQEIFEEAKAFSFFLLIAVLFMLSYFFNSFFVVPDTFKNMRSYN